MALTLLRINEIDSVTFDLLKECYGNTEIIPPIDLNIIIRHSGLVIKFGQFENPDIDGAFNRLEKVIYLAVSAPRNRQVFTAAHELGHYYLHHNRPTEVFYRHDALILDQAQEQEEQEANWFAASLLMPKDLVLRLGGTFGDSIQIAERFDVSAAAAYYRLKNLGLFTHEK